MFSRFALPAAVLLGLLASAPAATADTPLLVPQTPIVVPGGPGGFDYMQIDADMNRVMASHPSKSTLVVYDTGTKEVKQLDTDGEINGIAVDKADNKLFAGGHGGKVDVFDRTTLAKIDTITITGPADDIVLDRTSDTLWVCHDDGTEDWVIDAKTDKILGSATIDGAPEYVLYDKLSDKIYQNVKTANEIQVIDPATYKVTATWPTAPMTSPHGLAINGRTRHMFSAGDGKVVEFDMTTGKVISEADIATGYVDQIVFDRSKKTLYCASKVGDISVVRETDDGIKLAGMVTVPKGTHTLAVNSDTHSVWICYSDDTNSYLQEYTLPQ